MNGFRPAGSGRFVSAITPQIAQSIRSMRERGDVCSSIASQVGLSTETIKRFCRKNNIKPLAALDADRRASELLPDIISRRIAGMSCLSIAKETGISRDVVKRLLDRHKIVPMKKVSYKRQECKIEQERLMVQMRDNGASCSEIALEMGVSRPVVAAVFRARGTPFGRSQSNDLSSYVADKHALYLIEEIEKSGLSGSIEGVPDWLVVEHKTGRNAPRGV